MSDHPLADLTRILAEANLTISARTWLPGELGRHAYDRPETLPVGAVAWREIYGTFRRKTPYKDWMGNSYWEALDVWTPFDDYGNLRDLKAEGWHPIGFLTDDGPEMKR